MHQQEVLVQFAEYCSDLIWSVDRHLQLEFANRAFREFLEANPHAEKWMAHYQLALQGEQVEVQDDLLQLSFRPILQDGAVQGVMGHGRKLSQKETTSTALQNILDISLDVICTINREGRFVTVGSASRQLWGYAPEEMRGRSFSDLVYPEDLTETGAVVQSILRGQEVTAFENRYVRKDGRLAYNRWSAKWDAASGLIYAVARNAFEALEKEALMRQSEQRFRALVQDGYDLIGILNRHYEYTYVSPTSTTILGITPEEFIGKNPFAYIHPDDQAKTMASLELLSTVPKVEVEPFRFLNSKGEWRWIETVLTNMLQHPAVRGIVANSRDITERKHKEAEKELQATISQIFNTEKALDTALEKLCAAIAGYVDGDCAEVWIPQRHKGCFQLGAAYAASETGKKFYARAGEQMAIALEDGFAGGVLGVGPDAMIGIPLRHQEQLVGVLVTGGRGPLQQKTQQLSTLNKLETFIGSEISRKKLEQEFEQLFQVIPKLIVTLDEEGLIMRINPAGCELLAASSDELVGQSIAAFVHPHDHDTFREEFGKLDPDGANSGFSCRMVSKAGQTIWLNWSWNYQQHAGIIFASGRNITAEKKLTELQEDATTLARIGGWELNVQTKELKWSDQVHAMHETDPAGYQPVLHSALNFYHADYRERVSAAIDNTMQTGAPFDFEAILVTAKGRELWVRAIGRAEIRNGAVVRLYGSFQDINQQKQLELRLQSITNDLPGVTYQYAIYPGGSDEVVLVSKACEKIWGLTQEQVMADSSLIWNQVKAGGDYDALVKDVQHSVATKTLWHSRWRNVLPDGRLRWHEGYGTPYSLPDGTVMFNSMVFDITEEQQAKRLYEEAAQLALIGSWELNVKSQDDDRMYWSPMLKKILEIEDNYNASLSGGLEFYVGEHRERIQSAVQRIIAAGGRFDEELLIRTGKGRYKWVRCIGEAEFVNGECNRVFGSYQDIDDRKRTEEELKKAYEEKNRIIESISDAFFTTDNNFIVTYWNRSAERLIGVRREELVGRNLWEVFPNAVQLPSYRNYHKVLETGEPMTFEDYYGLWLEVNANKSEEGLTVFFRDISLRKEADRRLQEANERFEKVAEATNEAIWDWNLQTNGMYWGTGFSSLFGYSDLQEAAIQTWENRIAEEDRKRVVGSIRAAIEDPHCDTWEEEYRFRKADGAYAEVMDRGLVIRDRRGHPVRMVGAIRDLTIRKEYQRELKRLNEDLQANMEKLQAANEELEQFAFVASHDLQEPLRMVASFMDQLKRKYSDRLDDKANQYIFFASDGARRMKKIINDLLEFSRAGRYQDTREAVDLGEILQEYQALRRRILEEKSVQLLYDKLPVVQVQKVPLMQTLHCLLDNAIKYSRTDVVPEISVEVKEAKEEWIVGVRDNGIGIDPRFFDKIFVIFQRLHNRDIYEGTGIGLSLVKKHVESWGGRVWLESQPGAGSIFYFSIKKHNS